MTKCNKSFGTGLEGLLGHDKASWFPQEICYLLFTDITEGKDEKVGFWCRTAAVNRLSLTYMKVEKTVLFSLRVYKV